MKSKRQILIATRNVGKLNEFMRFFAGLPVILMSLAEFPDACDAEETGTTFEENAAIKADYFSRATGLWTMADDSGLEVNALNGAPGIRSARYAGPNATDAERMDLLLSEIKKSNSQDRRARFICALAFQRPVAEPPTLFVGSCVGTITNEPYGKGGFGYDPIFIPEGYQNTFGELSSEIKDRISHRARALKAATDFLERFLYNYE